MSDKNTETVHLEETSSKVYSIKGWKFRFDNTWTPANFIQVLLLSMGLLWGGVKSYHLAVSTYDTLLSMKVSLSEVKNALKEEVAALDGRVRVVETTALINSRRLDRLEDLDTKRSTN